MENKIKNIIPLNQSYSLDNKDYNLYDTDLNEEQIINMKSIAIVKQDSIKIKYKKDEYKNNLPTDKKIDIELDLKYIIKMRITTNILQKEANEYIKYTSDCFDSESKMSQVPYLKYFNMMIKGKYKINHQETILNDYVDVASLYTIENGDEDIDTGKLVQEDKNIFIGMVCTLKQFRGFGLMKILFQFMIDYYKKNNDFNRLSLNAVPTAEKYYLKFNFNYVLDNNNKKIPSYDKTIAGHYMELKV